MSNKMRRLLIVDDEPELLDYLAAVLRKEGYSRIYTAKSVKEAFEIFDVEQIDFAILDIMLPDGSGFDIIRHIRQSSTIPVLFLSAVSDIEQQYSGFDLGADDYIVKPFKERDLILRLQAILNRAYPEVDLVELESAQIDFSRALVIKEGMEISLTAKEFKILQVLYRNKNRIVSIDQILEYVWGPEHFAYENTLMAHMRKIRQKIELNPSDPQSLLTYKGLGYVLKVRA